MVGAADDVHHPSAPERPRSAPQYSISKEDSPNRTRLKLPSAMCSDSEDGGCADGRKRLFDTRVKKPMVLLLESEFQLSL